MKYSCCVAERVQPLFNKSKGLVVIIRCLSYPCNYVIHIIIFTLCAYSLKHAAYVSNPFEGDLHARVNLLIVLRDGLDIRVPAVLPANLSHSLLGVDNVDLLRRVKAGRVCLICVINAFRR